MRINRRIYSEGLVGALVLGSLYLTSFYSQLLAHTLAEMFRIAVAAAIFLLIWNVRRSLDNTYLMFVSIAYVFICGLDIVHTLASKEMGIFVGFGENLPAQLWIGARYMESGSLLVASFFLGRRLRLRVVFGGYAAATSLVLASIFYWKVFPICFVEGAGVTPFKKLSEYVVTFILALSIAVLVKKRDQFDPAVLRLLATAISFTILSESCFLLYADPAGFPQLLGHFLRIIAFYYIYRAIIEMGLAKPLAVLFRNLKASEDALRRERDFIAGVLSTQDVLVAVLDREGQIVRANKASELLTGYSFEELRGRKLTDLVIPEEVEELGKRFQEHISTRSPSRRENCLLTKDGRRVWLLWSASFLLDKNGVVEHVVASGIDITERKQAEEELSGAYNELDARVQRRTRELATANKSLLIEIKERKRIEEALRASETKYRTVADNTYDWEWWRDPLGNFIYVSPSCKKITQHEAEEFISDPDLLLRIIHPEDRSLFISHQTEVEQKLSSGEIEFRILRLDRSIRWLAHACQPVFDEQGRFLGRRGSNREITERKRAEEALRESEQELRHLSSRLLTAQETERRRISRELHDELGGALAVLKLRMSFIEKNLLAGQEELKAESRQSLQYIDQVIENVSRLSRDLSPSILEDIGLTPALRRLVDNFARNYQIKVVSDIGDLAQTFPKNSQIMIYRIFQEALTNIGKHAQAKNVAIQVRRDEERISFFVEDDGRGFDTKQVAVKKASEKGLGLVTMDERARMLGGTFELRSELGKGTRLTFSIPLNLGDGV